ncbi:acyl-CoA thioesterase II [Rhizobium sp. KVB221]|uniref:Acyl-CoA thioesterase 2 n=1 Tax=Rhizobium setariae TaxID=2801340 RepID=A0A937CRN2_9HYPH|nr:acyl-CoA thioesterase II [Rhizobium setariae]MBL0374917.1 acyl-CoA thioesterase II [Rhizobium setariae]
MTRPDIVVSNMEHLIGILDLEKIEENLFRGIGPNVGWQRVFGGLVISQALVAAQRTVVADRFVHSLHSYFLRPGDPAVPILYEVERIRDGASFTTRRVVAIQHGKPIFTLSASFQVDEPGFVHQSNMPDVPAPETLDDPATVAEKFLQGAPEHVKRYWLRERPFEMRPVSMTHYVSDEPLPALQHVWVRPNGRFPGDRALQSAFLAYLSDMTLLDTSLFPHGRSVFDRSLQVASLDHSMWFHSAETVDDWFLYTQDSPFGGGARGLSRGTIFSRSGRIIASMAQEGLIRNRAND